MKQKVTHKDRVAKVKDFAEKNKFFSFFAVILCVYIAFSLATGKLHDTKKTEKAASSQSEQISEEKGDTSSNESEEEKEEPLKWRFYSIDLWILLGGGGFCLIKILQEKRRAKEELQ